MGESELKSAKLKKRQTTPSASKRPSTKRSLRALVGIRAEMRSQSESIGAWPQVSTCTPQPSTARPSPPKRSLTREGQNQFFLCVSATFPFYTAAHGGAVHHAIRRKAQNSCQLVRARCKSRHSCTGERIRARVKWRPAQPLTFAQRLPTCEFRACLAASDFAFHLISAGDMATRGIHDRVRSKSRRMRNVD